MKETAAETPHYLFARPMAVGLGLAVLGGFLLLIAAAASDRGQRRQLESFEEVTAVGDRAYISIPDPQPKAPVPVATLKGQHLVPVSYKPVKIVDTRMVRAGKDDTGAYTVYTSTEEDQPQAGEGDRKGDLFHYLKVAPNEYLKARAGAPPK